MPVKVFPGKDVYSGCVNDTGVLKLEVTKPLGESMVTRILDSVENAAASKPKIDRFITKFARIYTPVVVAAAILTAVVPSVFTGNWNYWIYTAITFLVISCPCALVLSVPLAFFSGIGAGSRQGILFKGGVAIEALKDIKAVVMDKTGTITKGNFVVQKIVTLNRPSGDPGAGPAGLSGGGGGALGRSHPGRYRRGQAEFSGPALSQSLHGRLSFPRHLRVYSPGISGGYDGGFGGAFDPGIKKVKNFENNG